MKLEKKVGRGLKRLYQPPFPHVIKRKAKVEAQMEPKTDESVLERLQNANGEEAADLLHSDRFKSHPAAWQQTETIYEFLKRLPVADRNTANVGPWLWVSNPRIRRTVQKHQEKGDVEAFVKLGGELLHTFRKRRTQTEDENPGKPAATITRKMGPYRDHLKADLLSTAVQTGTTCGKWMLFPHVNDLPRVWRMVAEATSEGKLGSVSKVGTYDPFDSKDQTLICVYTYNFADMDDVARVLNELLDLDLCAKDGRTIYYKCDAYTYLGITSDNSYKLRASLFSSNELFRNEGKVRKEGPVSRLKKSNMSIDSFLPS